jgi:CspA family cold shock protein
MQTGTVKFFNETKGFGFILDEAGQEIFVHSTGLTGPVNKGDRIQFEVKQGRQGLNAINVKKA